jgi:tetratricopeptide (TPR) repeat protein
MACTAAFATQVRPPAPRPNRLERQWTSARRDYGRQDFTAAAEGFREILRLDPENPDVRRWLDLSLYHLSYERGNEAARKEDWARAVAEFQKGLDVMPENPQLREALRAARYKLAFLNGTKLASTNQLSEARRAFEECLVQKPDDVPALRQLQLLEARSAQLAATGDALRRVGALLQSADWADLDRLAHQLAGDPEIQGKGPIAQVLAARGRGDLQSAGRLARSLPDAKAGGQLLQYVESRRRLAFFQRWSLPGAVAYLLLLCGGIFCGLRQTLRAGPLEVA